MSSINTRTYESVPAQTVAFLGLGVMGGPMAGHLAKAGHSVTVYNRTPAKAQAWVAEFGAPGRHAPTPRSRPAAHSSRATAADAVVWSTKIVPARMPA